MTQLALSLSPPLTVEDVDSIHRARTDAYVTLCSLARASLDQRHRRNPPETEAQRVAMEGRLVAARQCLVVAWDAWDAVDEASRDVWARWVNGGRRA